MIERLSKSPLVLAGLFALAAAIGAGVLLNTFGWEAINMMVMPVITAMLVLLVWDDLRRRRAPDLARTR